MPDLKIITPKPRTEDQKGIDFLKGLTRRLTKGEISQCCVIFADDDGIKLAPIHGISSWGELSLLLQAVQSNVLEEYLMDAENA